MQSAPSLESSTSVGTWVLVPVKVRVDGDRELAGRVVGLQRGTADPCRTLKIIVARSSSSTIHVVV
jgi:hypothetical protein